MTFEASPLKLQPSGRTVALSNSSSAGATIPHAELVSVCGRTFTFLKVAVAFGITQVADGNWSVHAIIRKALFPEPPAA